jgi:hypothetical protein
VLADPVLAVALRARHRFDPDLDHRRRVDLERKPARAAGAQREQPLTIANELPGGSFVELPLGARTVESEQA